MRREHKVRDNPQSPGDGEDNPQSKITNDDAKAIRDLYFTGDDGPTMKDLAQRYGVSIGTISKIIHRRSYKHA